MILMISRRQTSHPRLIPSVANVLKHPVQHKRYDLSFRTFYTLFSTGWQEYASFATKTSRECEVQKSSSLWTRPPCGGLLRPAPLNKINISWQKPVRYIHHASVRAQCTLNYVSDIRKKKKHILRMRAHRYDYVLGYFMLHNIMNLEIGFFAAPPQY
jgi:hypothetical protein